MIQATTFKFLKDLKNNNNKEWFDKSRADYELAKEDFLQFTKQLLSGISKFDNNIDKANLLSKNCISRLNRDVRFSKDKSPYKTNFFAMINHGGRKSNFACYYFQLQPDNNSFTGGGVYMPMPPDLKKFRQEIDYNFQEWQGIVEGKSFKKVFVKGIQSPETLSRPPKGFDETNPAIDYLKMKGFYSVNNYTDQDLQSKNCIKIIINDFKAAKPFIDFLNNAL